MPSSQVSLSKLKECLIKGRISDITQYSQLITRQQFPVIHEALTVAFKLEPTSDEIIQAQSQFIIQTLTALKNKPCAEDQFYWEKRISQLIGVLMKNNQWPEALEQIEVLLTKLKHVACSVDQSKLITRTTLDKVKCWVSVWTSGLNVQIRPDLAPFLASNNFWSCFPEMLEQNRAILCLPNFPYKGLAKLLLNLAKVKTSKNNSLNEKVKCLGACCAFLLLDQSGADHVSLIAKSLRESHRDIPWADFLEGALTGEADLTPAATLSLANFLLALTEQAHKEGKTHDAIDSARRLIKLATSEKKNARPSTALLMFAIIARLHLVVVLFSGLSGKSDPTPLCREISALKIQLATLFSAPPNDATVLPQLARAVNLLDRTVMYTQKQNEYLSNAFADLPLLLEFYPKVLVLGKELQLRHKRSTATAEKAEFQFHKYLSQGVFASIVIAQLVADEPPKAIEALSKAQQFCKDHSCYSVLNKVGGSAYNLGCKFLQELLPTDPPCDSPLLAQSIQLLEIAVSSFELFESHNSDKAGSCELGKRCHSLAIAQKMAGKSDQAIKTIELGIDLETRVERDVTQLTLLLKQVQAQGTKKSGSRAAASTENNRNTNTSDNTASESAVDTADLPSEQEWKNTPVEAAERAYKVAKACRVSDNHTARMIFQRIIDIMNNKKWLEKSGENKIHLSQNMSLLAWSWLAITSLEFDSLAEYGSNIKELAHVADEWQKFISSNTHAPTLKKKIAAQETVQTLYALIDFSASLFHHKILAVLLETALRFLRLVGVRCYVVMSTFIAVHYCLMGHQLENARSLIKELRDAPMATEFQKMLYQYAVALFKLKLNKLEAHDLDALDKWNHDFASKKYPFTIDNQMLSCWINMLKCQAHLSSVGAARAATEPRVTTSNFFALDFMSPSTSDPKNDTNSHQKKQPTKNKTNNNPNPSANSPANNVTGAASLEALTLAGLAATGLKRVLPHIWGKQVTPQLHLFGLVSPWSALRTTLETIETISSLWEMRGDDKRSLALLQQACEIAGRVQNVSFMAQFLLAVIMVQTRRGCYSEAHELRNKIEDDQDAEHFKDNGVLAHSWLSDEQHVWLAELSADLLRKCGKQSDAVAVYRTALEKFLPHVSNPCAAQALRRRIVLKMAVLQYRLGDEPFSAVAKVLDSLLEEAAKHPESCTVLDFAFVHLEKAKLMLAQPATAKTVVSLWSSVAEQTSGLSAKKKKTLAPLRDVRQHLKKALCLGLGLGVPKLIRSAAKLLADTYGMADAEKTSFYLDLSVGVAARNHLAHFRRLQAQEAERRLHATLENNNLKDEDNTNTNNRQKNTNTKSTTNSRNKNTSTRKKASMTTKKKTLSVSSDEDDELDELSSKLRELDLDIEHQDPLHVMAPARFQAQALDQLNPTWAVCQVSLSEDQQMLYCTRWMSGKPPQVFRREISDVCSQLHGALDKILKESDQLTVRFSGQLEKSQWKGWWQARESQNSEMRDLAKRLQVDLLGPLSVHLLGQPSSVVKGARDPVVLILDKHLQRFPFETMPMFRGLEATSTAKAKPALMSPVTRLPALAFLLDRLQTKAPEKRLDLTQSSGIIASGIDMSKVFYVLNPSQDLPYTQKKFEDEFRLTQGWSGIAGRVPSPQEFQQGLLSSDFFIYCGHNAGEAYFDRDELSQLCVPSYALLMGCSSAALLQHGQYEPSGPALHYLASGAPGFIGNLWDITDKDIDKYTHKLIDLMRHPSLLAVPSVEMAAARSRLECTLSHMTGSAPVVYGIPGVVVVDRDEDEEEGE